MEKSKLGVSVGVLAAIACLFGLYGGYVITGVLIGYILLKEEDAWLKKFSVSIVVLMLAFSVASTVLNLIPSLLDMLYSLVNMFGGHFYLNFVENAFSLFSQVLSLAKTVVFILLALGALSQKVKKVPVIGNIVDKYMD